MNLTFICLWTWFFSPTSFLSALSLPPSLVSFHLLLCAHLSLKILPCGWFPRMKSLLCKCRSRVWILGTHMKGRPELRIWEADTGDPWGDLTAFTHPNQWILSSAGDPIPTMKCRAPEKDITHQLQTSNAYAPAHMWACMCVCIPHKHAKTQTRHTYRETNTALSSYGIIQESLSTNICCFRAQFFRDEFSPYMSYSMFPLSFYFVVLLLSPSQISFSLYLIVTMSFQS